MRLHLVLVAFVFGCSHKAFIGPDDGGGDAALVDGALSDSATPDGGPSPDSGNAGDQSFQSGTRLKVRYYVSNDGAQQALGFYDSQRNENCNFAMASDSTLRCLPEPGTVYALGTWFSDAQCTQPLLSIQTCVFPNAKEARVPTSTTCGTQFDVYTLGAPFTAATMYGKSGSTCTATSTTGYFASFSFYQAGAIIPSTSFQDGAAVTK